MRSAELDWGGQGIPYRVTALNWEVCAGSSLRRRHWGQDTGAAGLTHTVTWHERAPGRKEHAGVPPARLRCTRGPPGQLSGGTERKVAERQGQSWGAGVRLQSSGALRAETTGWPTRWQAWQLHGGGQEGSAVLTYQWHAGKKAAAAPWGIFLEAKEWVGTANLKVQSKWWGPREEQWNTQPNLMEK